MSSLYDKYYSQINKEYIYNLSCKIIKEEFNINLNGKIEASTQMKLLLIIKIYMKRI